ncbi:MAG: bis(5'-nucleosyl)-tetraphosphatase (symmetrical) YqeK [Thermotogota bacterium]
MDLIEIYYDLKKILKDQVKKNRYEHVLSVEKYADVLIKKHKIKEEKLINRIKIAVISHDLFRDIPDNEKIKKSREYGIIPNSLETKNPILLHGKIAAEYVNNNYNIDNEVFKAIYFHTSGNICFKTIGKILIISDTLEFNRSFKGVEKLREISYKNLEKSYFSIIKNRMNYSLKNDLPILNETYTLYNKLRGE